MSDILFLCSLHLKLVQLLKMHFDHTLNIFILFDPEILLLEIRFKEIKKMETTGPGERGQDQPQLVLAGLSGTKASSSGAPVSRIT